MNIKNLLDIAEMQFVIAGMTNKVLVLIHELVKKEIDKRIITEEEQEMWSEYWDQMISRKKDEENYGPQ